MIKNGLPRSDTRRFLSTGARRNTVWVLAVLIVGAVASWVGRSYVMPEVKKVAVSPADVRQLPSFPVTSSAPDEWDLIEGEEMRRWVFQPSGMASPVRVRLRSGELELEAGFDLLTGELTRERAGNPPVKQ